MPAGKPIAYLPMLRRFIRWQIKLSDAFDKLLPEEYRLDGNTHFVREFVNPYLSSGKVIYGVGGGGSPLISADLKKGFNSGLSASMSILVNFNSRRRGHTMKRFARMLPRTGVKKMRT